MKKFWIVLFLIGLAAIASIGLSKNETESRISQNQDVNQFHYTMDQDSGYSYEAPVFPVPSYSYPNSAYGEKRCRACGGDGRMSDWCTWCEGTGEDPSYAITKGSVLHSFALKDCAKCGGKGYVECGRCGGTGWT